MFWNNFYNICKRKGTTPNAICKEVGLSNSVATNWKNGTMPKADALVKIAELLECSIDYLLGRTDNPQSCTDSVPAISGAGNTLNKRDIELLQKINSMSLDDYTDTMNYINKKINK